MQKPRGGRVTLGVEIPFNLGFVVLGRSRLRPYMFYGGVLFCGGRVRPLLVAEGDDGVDAGGAGCWDGAGGRGYAQQDDGNG
jgi:hypothetical protein